MVDRILGVGPRVQGVLEPGEVIVATTRGMPTSKLSALAGAVLSSARFVATGVPDGSAPQRESASLEVFLCLTDRRLMIWSTAWHGRPREVQASLPINEIDAVRRTTVKAYWTLPKVKVTLSDGTSFTWASAKVHAGRTDRLHGALVELVTAGRGLG